MKRELCLLVNGVKNYSLPKKSLTIQDGVKEIQKDKKHNKKSIEKIRAAALKSKHRRLKKNVIIYTIQDGSKILLDSKWEEILAKIQIEKIKKLNERYNNIIWILSEKECKEFSPSISSHF